MQGPKAPWCVGSVLFPPQLLTKDLGPLVFNPLGDPQRLLSIGQRAQQVESAVKSSQLIQRFVKESATPFVPRDLLQDQLLTDSSSKQNNEFYGNLLQGLKCSDGSVVVFFIYGEGTDRIASTICRCGSDRKWSSIPASLNSLHSDDSEQADLSVSPSVQHSIQQLSAVWADFSEETAGKRLAIIAARTYYHVFFCTVSVEEDRLQYIATAVSKFQVATAHVAWSPYDNERAAVILESGTLCIFQIKASEMSEGNGDVEVIPAVILECSQQRCFANVSNLAVVVTGSQDQEKVHAEKHSGKNLHGSATEPTGNGLDSERKWWCCAFGWFPHTLLVANSQEILLVDLMKNDRHSTRRNSSETREVDTKATTSGIDVMVDLGAQKFSRFCSSHAEKEMIVALGRDPDGGSYEFSVATDRHVILFDARQPQTPILQWEHGMRQDLPSLLIMCPLSALRSLNDEDKVKHFQNGRIILAASFKSGDVRVFCYGSQVSRVELPLGKSPKKQKLEGYDWGTPAYALDIPSRLYAPLADVDDWRDVLSSSQGLYSKNGHRFVPKPHTGGQNVAGLVLLSEKLEPTRNKGKKTFTILQLTGKGELLAQTYKASHEFQDPSETRFSSVDCNSDDADFVGVLGPKQNEVKVEVLPAFLRYIRTGSILNPLYIKAKGKPNPGQHERGGGASSEFMKQDLTVVSSNLEKAVSKTEMEMQLKEVVRDLYVPMNMHEVARKVLSMGLLERLSHSDSGIPSDLTANWHRGYNFPGVSALLSSTASSQKFAEPRREGESADATLSNFHETVPLPLLLEVQSIGKSQAATSAAHVGDSCINPSESDRSVGGESFTNKKSSSGKRDHIYTDKFAGTFADGHQIITEGSRYVTGLVEQLASKQGDTVVSLNESTQNTNSEGELDAPIFLYSRREKDVVSSSVKRIADPEGSLAAADNGIDTMDTGNSIHGSVLHDVKESCRTFVEDSYSEFVVRKATSGDQESSTATHRFPNDPTLCPIKLCFTAPDEELDQVELAALEDLRGNFLQWQQSFPPYRNLQ